MYGKIQPENIFLVNRPSDRNYVKLLDFGIAKLTTEDGAMSQKTRTGMVIGTPTYMSPEQCDGKGNIDHRADIYALGVVMYELLTGKVPFPGEGFGEVLVAHLTREPDPPRTVNQNVPAELEAIVMRCLRKKREDRFQSMNDMQLALVDPMPHFQSFMQGQPAPRANGPVPLPGSGSVVMSAAMMPSGPMNLMGGPMSSGIVNPAQSGVMRPPGASAAMPAMMPQAAMSNPGQYGQPNWQQMQQMQMQQQMQQQQMQQQMRAGNPMASGVVQPGMIPGHPMASGVMQPGQMQSLQMPSMTPGPSMQMGAVQPGSGPRAQTPSTPQPSAPVESIPSPAAQSGARSTLSGANGETAGRRKPATVLAGFAAAMLVGSLSMFGVKQFRGGAPTVVAAPQKAVAVHISVKTDPPDAEIEQSGPDGKNVVKAPYTFDVKKDSGEFSLKIRASGYQEESRTIHPSEDQNIAITLAKQEKPSEPSTDTGSTPKGKTEAVAAKEPKEVKEPKEPKEPKEGKAAKEPKEPKEGKAAKEPKEPKEGKAAKEPKEPKEGKAAKEPKEPKEGKAAKEPKEPKDGKAVKEKGGKKKKEDLMAPVF